MARCATTWPRSQSFWRGRTKSIGRGMAARLRSRNATCAHLSSIAACEKNRFSPGSMPATRRPGARCQYLQRPRPGANKRGGPFGPRASRRSRGEGSLQPKERWCLAAFFAPPLMLDVSRNSDQELRAGIANSDSQGAFQLLCEKTDDSHSESLWLAQIKVRWQASAFVAHGH